MGVEVGWAPSSARAGRPCWLLRLLDGASRAYSSPTAVRSLIRARQQLQLEMLRCWRQHQLPVPAALHERSSTAAKRSAEERVRHFTLHLDAMLAALLPTLAGRAGARRAPASSMMTWRASTTSSRCGGFPQLLRQGVGFRAALPPALIRPAAVAAALSPGRRERLFSTSVPHSPHALCPSWQIRRCLRSVHPSGPSWLC